MMRVMRSFCLVLLGIFTLMACAKEPKKEEPKVDANERFLEESIYAFETFSNTHENVAFAFEKDAQGRFVAIFFRRDRAIVMGKRILPQIQISRHRTADTLAQYVILPGQSKTVSSMKQVNAEADECYKAGGAFVYYRVKRSGSNGLYTACY